jgi:hypothetical protein
VLTAKLLGRNTVFLLLENGDNLSLGELCLFHRQFKVKRFSLILNCLLFWDTYSWYPGLELGGSVPIHQRTRLDLSTRVAFIRSVFSWQWMPVTIGFSRKL